MQRYLLLFIFFISGFVHGASFDCSKAKSAVEKSVCGNSLLSQLDEKLANAYKTSITSFPVKNYVKFEQKEWIKYTRNNIDCKKECSNELIKAYEDRISELSLADKSLVFSNTREFDYGAGDAVIKFIPEGSRYLVKILGGFRIHRVASENAGKPIYVGCEFSGYAKTLFENSAKDPQTKQEIFYKISDNKLKFTKEPEICVGFGSLPDDFLLIK